MQNIPTTREKAIFSQTNWLIEANYFLTPIESDLIYAMISLIHPDDTEFKSYTVRILDIARYMGVNEKNAYRELKKISKKLASRVLEVETPEKLLLFHWVDVVEIERGYLTFHFNNKLKPFLLFLRDSAGFTKISFQIITCFKSFHTKRIYQLLKQYKNTKNKYRDIEVSDLKKMLGLQPENYEQFKYFNKNILLKSKKEFEAKTPDGFNKCDLTFKLETFRTGRSITRLRFHIIDLSFQRKLPLLDIVDIPTNPEIYDLLEHGITRKDIDEISELYSPGQIREILNYYEEKIKQGKVKNKGGGYLLTLFKTGGGLKTDYEKKERENKERRLELKRKKEQSSRKKEEEKQLQEERKLLKLEEEFAKKSNEIRESTIAEFEKTLHPVVLKSFKKNGINSVQFREQFFQFSRDNIKENREKA